MFSLPNELILLVAEHLHLDDLATLHSTSDLFGSLLQSSLLKAIKDNADGIPLFCWAVEHPYADSLVLLKLTVASGEDVNMLNNEGWSALRISVRQKNVSNVRFLLMNGADPDIVYADRTAALMTAVDLGQTEIAELLLFGGARIHLKANFRRTEPIPLLHRVAMQEGENVELLDLLIKYGARTNKRSHERTALHVAIIAGKHESVRLLLKGSADIEAKDRDGNTPLRLATAAKDQLMIQVLLEYGAVNDVSNFRSRSTRMSWLEGGIF